MLNRVADGVLVHESEFCRSNAVVVQGAAGVLLIDPGVYRGELACLADDLRELGLSVVAGFSTHPHWDHLLWHAEFGPAPRYATGRCAAVVAARLPDAAAKSRIGPLVPPDIFADLDLDLLGVVEGLPAGTTLVPWDGPRVRIVEHQAHASGHAALVIEGSGVLVAGDMLSDELIPFLDLGGGENAIEDYLDALRLFDQVEAEVVVPGHGSVGGAGELRARIDRDRAYVEALRDGRAVDDPRIGAWAAVHERQEQARKLLRGQ